MHFLLCSSFTVTNSTFHTQLNHRINSLFSTAITCLETAQQSSIPVNFCLNIIAIGQKRQIDRNKDGKNILRLRCLNFVTPCVHRSSLCLGRNEVRHHSSLDHSSEILRHSQGVSLVNHCLWYLLPKCDSVFFLKPDRFGSD